jgi:VanZ family protein
LGIAPIRLKISCSREFSLASLCCFVFIVFIAGVWPFNFWQANKVSQDSVNGLRLTSPATLYTINVPDKLLELREFTILLDLSSEFFESNGYARILSYSLDDEHSNFMIGQWEDSLVLKLSASGKPEPIHFETDGVLKKGEKGCIAIIFNGEKLVLYLNGEMKNEKKTGPLSFANWDGSYPLVIGSESNGKFPWEGNICSIKIFDWALSGGETGRLASLRNAQINGQVPLIDYSFDAGGSAIKDRGKGQSADLVIPKRFEPYKRAFLENLSSLNEIRGNIWDSVMNLFGFIPLGFFLSGCLNRPNRSVKYAFLLAIMFGFLLSLTIEVLQAFLPTRSSSMTDLMANTLGAAVGFFVYKVIKLKGILTVGRLE